MSRPKGFKHSEQTKLKIRLKHLGMKATKEAKKSMSVSAKKRTRREGKAVVSNEFGVGSRHKESTKKSISESMTGIKRPYKPRPHLQGEKSPFWRGGVSGSAKKRKASARYRKWRSLVFQRDDYTCQFCGRRGGRIEADHIKPSAHFPKLRYVLENGRTLCKECHKTTDTWGSRTMWRKYEKV